MSEKVGIITFHRADNLGAVLQAFALCEFINNELGIHTEIIDYKCEEIEKSRYYTGENKAKSILLNIYYAIKRKGFDSFRNKYLQLSDSDYTLNGITESNEDYSTFISGSDQVWNIECSGKDYSFFLDFVKDEKRKVAYAASIGTCVYSDEELSYIRKLLLGYDAISVREVNVIERFQLAPNTNVLPDPVFLLDGDKWKKLIHHSNKKKYVFVYLIQEDVNVIREATKYAKKNKCKLIINKKSLSFILNNSPEKFIEWIANAEAVFTNSFHGTAFSMIFQKKLGADIELKDGRENNRVKGILMDANLEKCIISKSFNQPEKACAINWVKEQKNKAYEFLKETILDQRNG